MRYNQLSGFLVLLFYCKSDLSRWVARFIIDWYKCFLSAGLVLTQETADNAIQVADNLKSVFWLLTLRRVSRGYVTSANKAGKRSVRCRLWTQSGAAVIDKQTLLSRGGTRSMSIKIGSGYWRTEKAVSRSAMMRRRGACAPCLAARNAWLARTGYPDH